jgi:hypothetical protein
MAFGEPLMPRYARVANRLDAGLAAGFGYVALAGFSILTQRAVTLLAVVMAALILNRTTRPGYTFRRSAGRAWLERRGGVIRGILALVRGGGHHFLQSARLIHA